MKTETYVFKETENINMCACVIKMYVCDTGVDIDFSSSYKISFLKIWVALKRAFFGV